MTDEIPTIEAGQKMPEATIHTKSEDGIDAVGGIVNHQYETNRDKCIVFFVDQVIQSVFYQ